jgi:chlorite dismutase
MSFDPLTARPREIEAHLRSVLLKYHGDAAENAAKVHAVRGGSYVVSFKVGDEPYELKFRRKSVKQIAKVIRALRP